MKSLIAMTCLCLCVVALLGSASAQEMINFANLPLVKTPSPVPDGYGRLAWSNFYYVNARLWSGSGPGDLLGPQGEDIAFIGNRDCRLIGDACYGILTNAHGLVLMSATVAASFGPTHLTVMAYNNGKYLGSAGYFLTTQLQTLRFPPSWGVATEVVFQVTGEPDSLAVYTLEVFTLGG